MQLPSLITVEGAYWYFITLLLAIAFGFALYIAAGVLGLVPGPQELVPGGASLFLTASLRMSA
ncbi:hypothetical protein [Halomarina rubra]|uniref:Uncharacterized protein n=1 Tax=Halomarina rubra TaxID=2071873 RepID=A0ABD6ASB7_9EURY|nr:hypothetical protein [Halomarina rubra]